MADRNLYYLEELDDYKVASGYPDVRGWKVTDAGGRTVGKVDNLLVNKKAERVVYLDVEVDESLIREGHEPLSRPASEGVHEFVNKEGEDHLIIPIGLAGINEDHQEVFCDRISYDMFRSARRFSKGRAPGPEYEAIVYRHYLPDEARGEVITVNDDFYNREGFRGGHHKG